MCETQRCNSSRASMDFGPKETSRSVQESFFCISSMTETFIIRFVPWSMNQWLRQDSNLVNDSMSSERTRDVLLYRSKNLLLYQNNVILIDARLKYIRIHRVYIELIFYITFLVPDGFSYQNIYTVWNKSYNI